MPELTQGAHLMNSLSDGRVFRAPSAYVQEVRRSVTTACEELIEVGARIRPLLIGEDQVGWVRGIHQSERKHLARWVHDNTALAEHTLMAGTTSWSPASGLIFQCDRGSQYAGRCYTDLLTGHEIKVSMSRKSNCWDNACSETLFGSLKVERLHGMEFYNHREAKDATLNWLLWYNGSRMHSTLRYLSLAQFEQQANARQLARAA